VQYVEFLHKSLFFFICFSKTNKLEETNKKLQRNKKKQKKERERLEEGVGRRSIKRMN
jgi:hypothetical protein